MNQRGILAALWLTFFAVFVTATTWLYMTDALGAELYRRMLSQLSASFTPYLSAVLGFFFAGKLKAVPEAPKSTFVVAVAVSCFWNVLMLLYIVPLLFGHGFIEDATDMIRDTGALLAWLVGPGIGFYFGSQTA